MQSNKTLKIECVLLWIECVLFICHSVKQEVALRELRSQLDASAEKGRLLRLEAELRDTRKVCTLIECVLRQNVFSA